MTRSEINFLDEKDKLIKKPKKKLLLVSKIIVSLLIIFIILVVSFSFGIISSGENLSKTLGNLSLWQQIKHLISSNDKQINGEEQDRINILMLGIGGEGHDGPYLTDTMILASIKPSTKQVSMISIPRDLLVPVPGYGWRKINTANSFGESSDPGRGGDLASKVVSNIFNLPIHYYIRVDFDGFMQMINDLGGVTIDVENTLNDMQYPVKGKETATTSERYEHLYIEKGTHHLDGATALKYVRSRHAAGIEGSDFARAQRQQKVIVAVKDKLLAFDTIFNPYRITRIMDTLSQHLKTNMQVWEILRLSQLVKGIDRNNIFNRVLDDGPTGPLYSAMSADGAFVLKTKTEDFSELQSIAQNIFSQEAATPPQVTRIEIQNGTKINGLAFRTSQYLQSLGYQIIKVKNAPTQDYEKSVIYSLKNSDPDYIQHIIEMAKVIGAEFSPIVPSWAQSTSSALVSPNADILIILGQDQKDL